MARVKPEAYIVPSVSGAKCSISKPSCVLVKSTENSKFLKLWFL